MAAQCLLFPPICDSQPGYISKSPDSRGRASPSVRPLPGKPHAFARVPTPLRPRQRACICPDTLTATDRMTTVSTLQRGTRSPRRPSGEERGHSCPEHTQGLAGTAGASSVWGHAQERPCRGPSWSVHAGTLPGHSQTAPLTALCVLIHTRNGAPTAGACPTASAFPRVPSSWDAEGGGCLLGCVGGR